MTLIMDLAVIAEANMMSLVRVLARKRSNDFLEQHLASLP